MPVYPRYCLEVWADDYAHSRVKRLRQGRNMYVVMWPVYNIAPSVNSLQIQQVLTENRMQGSNCVGREMVLMASGRPS